MTTPIAGPAAVALAALTPAQLSFIRSLPKAELHAHLNGSIPLSVLQSLAAERLQSDPSSAANLAALEKGVVLNEISDFFGLFPAIYSLTNTAPALARVTRAVLEQFLGPGADGQPECTYIELRTGPRATEHLTRRRYLEAVLDEIEKYPVERAALIVALDRPVNLEVLREVVALAAALRGEGRRVVGVDLCGDPLVSKALSLACAVMTSSQGGNVTDICKQVEFAKEAGLKVTLHVAEVHVFTHICTSMVFTGRCEDSKKSPRRSTRLP